MALSKTEIDACIDTMLRAAELDPSSEDYIRLENAAAALRKSAKKQRRRARNGATIAHDRAVLRATGLTVDRFGPVDADDRTLLRERLCYACKTPYREVHAYFHTMCVACGDVCLAKRAATLSLEGRRALVTGGRIKIGFATALRLLRAGASVDVTTRFPNDALRRYRAEPDFDDFQDRLRIVAADFRYLGSLLARIDAWNAEAPFDILINNAAQTVWRPPEYARALRAGEETTPEARRWIVASANDARVESPSAIALPGAERSALAELFPPGMWDAHGNPLDLRSENSWVQRLADIDPIQLVESQLVNAMAPFLLASRLKPSFLRARRPDRYIVNVSALEGMFSRVDKSPNHPHTNMAKASLNMLTRTSADDYARDGIYMVSVDPGWMSHEVPHAQVLGREARGMHTPLTAEDSAARVCDPIAQGVAGAPVFGVLLKDFREVPW